MIVLVDWLMLTHSLHSTLEKVWIYAHVIINNLHVSYNFFSVLGTFVIVVKEDELGHGVMG